jgi:Carboxypeptidase regulatory-like domain
LRSHADRLRVFRQISVRAAFGVLVALAFLVAGAHVALGQQTLGSLNGTVTDSSGAVVQAVSITARALATNLKVTAQSKADGSFSIADLPIGNYEVTFTKAGFEKALYPQIIVQGNRVTTVNAQLKPGAVSSSVPSRPRHC